MSESKLVSRFRDLAIAASGYPGSVLALDPGETTGWAFFQDYRLIKAGQIQTGSVRLAYLNIYNLMASIKAECGIEPSARGDAQTLALPKQLHIAAEDYRIYSWKADDHSWSSVHTVKAVGFVELCAMLHGLPAILRMAQHAKNFATDDRLNQWGFWVKGQRHARDAIRHAALYICDYKNNKARP